MVGAGIAAGAGLGATTGVGVVFGGFARAALDDFAAVRPGRWRRFTAGRAVCRPLTTV
jgi:hypothetical protein